MVVVTGAMGTLLPKLAALLTKEYKLEKRLRGEIMFLKAELESMQAALVRVSEVPVIDDQIKIWARDVRELSYDVEDSIDKFMVRVDNHPTAQPHGFRGFIDRCLRLLTQGKLRHQIATDIKAVKPLVKEVAARRDRYKVDNVTGQPTSSRIDPRLHGIYVESTKLVAMGGPREELGKLLMEEESMSAKGQLKVISIVGVGGVGKTTLANVLYQQLRGQFECCAFVPVSLKPDLKRILSSILRQVSEQDYTNIETWEAEELINKIRKVLEDKRYFIIIDDIWDESVWKIIKCALAENNCSSRIITTTRVARVAESCCSDIDGSIYKLKPLSHGDSKKLFYKRIFGCEDGCHPELKEISEKILKKCDGVPLAIITIASLLTNKPRNINQWNSVHNSIGSGHEKCTNMENMRQILSISYYDLPSHLKPCLLYLSVFPEDYSISTYQLVRRWIAEGFVNGTHVDALALYELGKSYLFELINRSMIQPEYMHANGGVESCHVHDMILDLITSLSTEENFVTILDGHQPTRLPKKIRRLSLQNSEEEHNILQATMSLSHVRSLIIFPSATNLMPPLSSFQVLQVLELEHCRNLDNHHITGVGNLFHLRHLGLRDTNITKLPKEIGNLHCLQTLDLNQTGITDLPSTIVQLKHLLCLFIETSVRMPDGIGNMESLQLLASICVSRSPNFVKDLGNLTELRVLNISLSSTWNRSYEKPLLDSLCNLHKIKELHIQCFGVPAEFIVDLGWFPQHLTKFALANGGISKLPRWMNSSLSDLSIISIKLDILRQEDLQNLGALPFLHELKLTVLKIESTEEKLIIGTDDATFQCLTKFNFMSDAMGLLFAQGAMPSLLILEVIFRVRETKDAYGDFNLGLENLFSVRQVTIRICCRGSRVCEVDDADAAMQMATSMNPNHPSLDVIRHYEEEMIDGKVQLQANKETMKEEEDEIVLQRVGPWGGDGGRDHDIMLEPRHLESVKVCSGTVVDALGFSYRDKFGKKHTTPLWGGVGGGTRTIHLGPSEFVVEVSGTYGPFSDAPNIIITSLTLVTNVRSYGPFGTPQGTTFHTRAKRNSSIVGFFGRSSMHLEAIGVYVHP